MANVTKKINPLVVASGNLTTNEKKIFNTALNIMEHSKKIDGKLRWETSFEELKELSGLSSNERVHDAFRGLKNADINIYDFLLKKVNGEHRSLSNFECKYMSAFAFDNATEEFYFEITQTLYDLLQEKQSFALIDIKAIKSIKSKHALWLYEMVNDYDNIGKRTLTIDQIKILAGLKQEQYTEIKYLKRDVINKAVEELNKKSSWTIEYEANKRGKNIYGFTFTFKNNLDDENNKKRLFRLWLQNYHFQKNINIGKELVVYFHFQKNSETILLFDATTKRPFPKKEAQENYEKLYAIRDEAFKYIKEQEDNKAELRGIDNIDQALNAFEIQMQEWENMK